MMSSLPVSSGRRSGSFIIMPMVDLVAIASSELIDVYSEFDALFQFSEEKARAH
jgi:hypothetical protein